jgi:hypothetical protein
MRYLLISTVLFSSCQVPVEISSIEEEVTSSSWVDCAGFEPIVGSLVTTSCGGTQRARAVSSNLGVAAASVIAAFPTAAAAADVLASPSYMGAHPTNGLGGQAELEGFGVTFIQEDGFLNPLENASGALDDPNLLFFQKVGTNKANWPIIGMGYSFEFDPCSRPIMENIHQCNFLVHEAGYHDSPGTGGFECATNSDLKSSAISAGKSIDSDKCIAIEDLELKDYPFNLDVRHGRIWTVHVWFEPGTKRPIIAETDPFCRQSSSALEVDCGSADAFSEQGDCSEVCN